jgi:hypothetical protein
MKPPAKSTLFRMQQTAQAAADNIEFGQDARVRAGDLTEPMPDQVRKRDDFIGMVRLIEAILSDQVIIERLKARMSAQTILATDTDVEVAD